nr:unnamed protein product [Callosobruchus analis]
MLEAYNENRYIKAKLPNQQKGGIHVWRCKEVEFHFPVLCTVDYAQNTPKEDNPAHKVDGTLCL